MTGTNSTTSTLPGETEDRDGTWRTVIFVWRAVRKSWVLASAVLVVGVVTAVFITLGQTKIFRATGTIQIDPTPPRPLGNEIQSVVEMGTGAYLNNREYYETQYRILQSRRVAVTVVETLGLHRDAAFLQNAPPGIVPPPAEVSKDAAAEVLRSRVDIEPEKQSRLVSISVRDADPARAQRLVNAVVDSYREQNLDNVLSSTNSAVDWLRGQLGKLKTELESNELALHQYKRDKNILSLSLDEQSNMLRGEMVQLNELLTGVRAKREQLDARRLELNKISGLDTSDLASSELLASPLLQRFRETYVDALKDHDSLLAAGKGPAHPETASAASKVARTRAALLSEVANVKGAIEREHRAVTREVAGLQRLYDSANKRALELNLMEIEFNRLRRSKDNTERLYSMVQDRTKESDLTLMMRVNNIHVVDAPLLPQRPVRPSLPLNVAGGMVAGLLLGLGLALGRELVDSSVKTPEDVESELRVPFLGLLPALGPTESPARRRRRRRTVSDATGTSKPELVVHDHPTSGIAEAARAIRTNILFMSPDHPYRVLLVTSAAPTEGKTTVATCIATAMAQAGQRVVLVDCDMRRPRIHKVFDHENSLGLTSALLDISVLDSAVFESPVPKLSVLTCGPVPPNPAELLHSEAFGRVLDRLREKFDRIVIDSPPLGPVTDGAVLATRVDGTVFVVRAFKTSKEVARRALRTLRNVKGTLVGAVLNGVSPDRPGYKYYYQHYYYRQGYSPDNKADDSTPPPPRDDYEPASPDQAS